MHHPPEVQFSVGGSLWPRRVFTAGSLLALLQVVWFVLSNRPPTWRTTVVAISLLVALGLAWLWTRGSTNGGLHWDGVQWQWSRLAAGGVTLQRHLDFQTLMLVSLHSPKAAPVWLWLRRSQDPNQWRALRRAVAYAATSKSTHRTSGSAPARRTAKP